MEQIKIKTDIKVSQAIPYLKKIAALDGLHIMIEKDFKRAWEKFRMLLMICEQYVNKEGQHQPLQYWVNRDFRIANYIYEQSLDFRTSNDMYDILIYKN